MKRYTLFLLSCLLAVIVNGQSSSSPLFIGSKNAAFEYKHTAFCYNPGYQIVSLYGLWYTIDIRVPMKVSISNDGSPVTSTAIYMTYNGQYDYITHSEGSNGECSHNKLAYLDAGILLPGRYYIMSITNGAQSGKITTTIKGTVAASPVKLKPTKTQNYILAKKPTVPASSSANLSYNECIQTIEYYDELGYPMENILFKAAPDGSDQVTYQEYNSVHKESNSWLPAVVSANDGAFVSLEDFKAKAKSTYSNDLIPYSKPIYDASPLYKVTEQYGPGQKWHNDKKRVKIEYLTNDNITNGVLSCPGFRPTNDKNGIKITTQGYYPGKSLYVTKTTDEDDKNITYEFKNKLGQVVLIRQINGDKRHDTSFVYDAFGNLRAVLPPLFHDSNSTWDEAIDRYAYLYKYDSRNRVTGKKLPGASWITYVYDKANRMIFSQNGEQALSKQWSFYLYDNLNRQVLQGVCTNTNTANIANTKVTTSFVPSNTGIGNSGYSSSFALVSPTVYQVNYYDDYNFRYLNGFNNANFPAATNTGKGALTATVTTVLDTSAKLYSANYFDIKGNLVDVVSTNHIGGYDKTTTTYTFTGKPQMVKQVHTAPGKTTQTQVYKYTYDHVERLKTVTHQLNSGSTVTLVNNTYDNLGRLQKNSRNGIASLADNYSYDVRSLVTKISGTQFTENLSYRYNGDIATMDWTTNGQTRKYSYNYDDLSRLTSAGYTGASSLEDYKTSYGYDKHGNIEKITRYGKTAASAYGIVDNLAFTYTGNQLTNVAESGPNVSLTESNDFKKKSYTGNGYAYNKNGAMTKDLNKGISAITYNSLSLPKSLTVNGVIHAYTYSADGRKLKVVQGSTNRDYSGCFIYENGSLKRILVTGGYIEGGVYYFNLNDHQGNARVVANANGTAIQRNHYYPFGLPFAETTSADQSKQPYKYNGKEFDRTNGVNLYDYSARYMDPAIGRFTTIDPMAEKYYSSSPYSYCLNNPVKYVDPDGEYVAVRNVGNGTFEVIGGIANKDLNIYIMDPSGSRVGTLGKMLTSHSFHTEDGKAVEGTIINPNDKSGMIFLNYEVYGEATPFLLYYMPNATGGRDYDFKRRGMSKEIDNNKDLRLQYIYRGMIIQNAKGEAVYASARDIGNVAAGYLTGKNFVAWPFARMAFDALQSIQQGRPSIEGLPSQKAQMEGHVKGISDFIIETATRMRDMQLSNFKH